jgi:hypothetical protein
LPLRDHFRPPLDDRTSWDGFHGQWPAMIVMALFRQLPERYVAAPHIHLGSSIEIVLPDQDEYEVQVFDTRRDRQLVAAIKIVSPANKDRPEHRRAFVVKCAALLRERACVAIVDLVTTCSANLYADLLELHGMADPLPSGGSPPLYAVSCRWTRKEDAWILENWAHPLTLGEPLPTLPLWLAENLAVPLELEPCYEETCRVLRIP